VVSPIGSPLSHSPVLVSPMLGTRSFSPSATVTQPQGTAASAGLTFSFGPSTGGSEVVTPPFAVSPSVTPQAGMRHLHPSSSAQQQLAAGTYVPPVPVSAFPNLLSPSSSSSLMVPSNRMHNRTASGDVLMFNPDS
jgi:hypothetical protein